MSAESSFRQAGDRMLEHHGVEVSVSAIREMTLRNAQKSKKILSKERKTSLETGSDLVNLEMDGVMVPTVEYEDSKDRRKAKTLQWKEIKVGAIQDPKCVEPKFACSMEGADALGDRLIIQMHGLVGSFIPNIHGLADGALWTIEQGERIGGSRYGHLIDFYHLSEYLSDAFEGDSKKALMLKRSQQEVRLGEIQKVAKRLKRRQKLNPKHEGIMKCLKYIKNRPGQFKYKEAIEKDLPIGSGLIESTNRSLIQKRLKIPGAWWLAENADDMAQLRTLRANGFWEELWEEAA